MMEQSLVMMKCGSLDIVTGTEGWTAHPEFGCFSLFAFLTPASSQPPREPTTTTPFVQLNAPSLGSFSWKVGLRKLLNRPFRLLLSCTCGGLGCSAFP